MSKKQTNNNVIIADQRNTVFYTHTHTHTFQEKIWHLLHFGMSFLGEYRKDKLK